MSVLNLDKLFHPESVALIGASDRDKSLGNIVMRNLMAGGFAGPILPVNPKYRTIRGVYAYQTIDDLPVVPDLAVICTPAATVPQIITQLGEKGTRAVVVISSGFHENNSDHELENQMLAAAEAFDLRILGPNCVGVLIPRLGLNASFVHTGSLDGNIAVISQSGAICTAILDWAKSRGIGFSSFISLGNGSDIDFADLLDYLAVDSHTRGILLYIESIKEARKFMSAARAASRNKNIIVIKSGRIAEGARAAASHTGALAADDDVFDAAIRRAGMLRVYTIQNLFDAVETLAHAKFIKGNRLAILTNGGGIGVLATDYLVRKGGKLAELSADTIASLDRCLPPAWSHSNPVDIIGDSDAERYVNALSILLKDDQCDAILVMLVPVAVIDNREVAQKVADLIRQSGKPVLTCWMGAETVADGRRVLEQAGIMNFETPESAIRAFLQIVEYDRNQQSLMEVPPTVPENIRPDRQKVDSIISQVLKENRTVLTEPESKQVLAAYDIPVVETRIAATVEEVLQCADELGYPVAIKVLSKNISHKSDMGGVLLDIETPYILRAAAEGMLVRIRQLQPDVQIDGFTVQKMVHRPGAYELILGVNYDPVFGPIILFGEGGTPVEVIKDRAVALPPLNMNLARYLIERTRIFRELRGYRNIPPVDLTALQLALVKISQLIVDHGELQEIDINPVFADSKGVLAVDARMVVAPATTAPAARLAICPYPQELEEQYQLANGMQLLLRPIKPEDEPAHHYFLTHTDPKDIYFRFFRSVSNLSHSQMARFTQIDYDREMAFIASTKNEQGENETIGVVRAVSYADDKEAEFAIIVRTDMQNLGIGKKLMEKIIGYIRAKGIKRLTGQTLLMNIAMQNLARKLGFKTSHNLGEETIDLSLEL